MQQQLQAEEKGDGGDGDHELNAAIALSLAHQEEDNKKRDARRRENQTIEGKAHAPSSGPARPCVSPNVVVCGPCARAVRVLVFTRAKQYAYRLPVNVARNMLDL